MHTHQGQTKHTAKYGGKGTNFGLPRFHKEIKIRPKSGLGKKKYAITQILAEPSRQMWCLPRLDKVKELQMW